MVEARRSLVILLTLLIITLHAKLILVQVVTVFPSQQMVITTRFKNSDILLSSRTRQLATTNNGNYSDMGQLPTVKVEYQTTPFRKWRQIGYNNSVYLMKTAVDEADLHDYLQKQQKSSRVVLLPRQYQQYAKESTRVCLYDPVDLADDRLTNFLDEFLEEKISTTPSTIQTLSNPSPEPTLYPVSIALSLLWALTLGKTLFVWRSQGSLSAV